MLDRISVFMMWKQALAFVLVTETSEPDAVYAVGVSKTEQHNALSRITRAPRPWTAANFSAPEWLEPQTISPVLLKLLPRVPQAMTPKHIHGLQEWFGVSGRFPAVHVPSGEMRGV